MLREQIGDLFETKIEQLNAQLIEAKLVLAEGNINGRDWQSKADDMAKCKSIQAQMDILHAIDYLINDMLETQASSASSEAEVAIAS